jgi:hypothetical protein
MWRSQRDFVRFRRWRFGSCLALSGHVARFPLSALLVAGSLLACGGKSLDGAEPSGGGSGQGGTGSGSASGSGAGAVAQGGRAPSACEAFTDDDGTLLGVQIINHTSQSLYLGSTMITCGSIPLFDVEYESGERVTSVADCRSACDTARVTGPSACPDLCRLPSAIRLQPGEVYPTTWSGLDYVKVEMPAACVTPPYGVAQCDRAQRIEPGAFVFSAQAGTSVDCSAASPSGDCGVCRLDEPACVADGGLIGGELRTAKASVFLDESYGIYPKQKDAPGEAPAGDANIAQALVQIVFTN